MDIGRTGTVWIGIFNEGKGLVRYGQVVSLLLNYPRVKERLKTREWTHSKPDTFTLPREFLE